MYNVSQYDATKDLEKAAYFLKEVAKINSFQLVPTGTECLTVPVVHAIEEIQQVFIQNCEVMPGVHIEQYVYLFALC